MSPPPREEGSEQVTDIVLVRHGETTWHAHNRYAGGSDIPLTARGRAEADRLARWARTAGSAAVWSSDLSRTQLNTRPCAEPAGLELRLDRRLREVDFVRNGYLNEIRLSDGDAALLSWHAPPEPELSVAGEG